MQRSTAGSGVSVVHQVRDFELPCDDLTGENSKLSAALNKPFWGLFSFTVVGLVTRGGCFLFVFVKEQTTEVVDVNDIFSAHR